MTQTLSNKGNDEEKFYDELDDKKAHDSCCTCQTIVILFIIILILGLAIVVYLYFQITRGNLSINPPAISATQANFDTKVKDIKLDNSGEFQIILTPDDLNSLLNNGISTSNFALNNISTSINSSNVLIYGTLIKPINSKVAIETTPRVSSFKIVLDVNKITAGSINLPNFLTQSISNSISDSFNQKMEILYKSYIIDKVSLEENKMIITGQKK